MMDVRPAPPHVEQGYFILSHLDLRRDAASLLVKRATVPSWVAALHAAYVGDPTRLTLQHWPLRVSDSVELRSPNVSAALREAFAEAVDRTPIAIPPSEPHFVNQLYDLVNHTFALCEQEPPDLEIQDCPSLGPHARAIRQRRKIVVATSLAEPPEWVLLQLLHEICHFVTDSLVRSRLADRPPRDTLEGTPGYDVHRALEAAAIGLTEVVIETYAADLRPALDHWLSRHQR